MFTSLLFMSFVSVHALSFEEEAPPVPSSMGVKLLIAAVIFMVLSIVGLVPSYVSISTSTMLYGSLFCAGVFLATALIHMIHSSAESFGSIGVPLQVPLVAMLAGLLLAQLFSTLLHKMRYAVFSEGESTKPSPPRYASEEETPLKQELRADTGEFPTINRPNESPEHKHSPQPMFDVHLTPAPLGRIYAAISPEISAVPSHSALTGNAVSRLQVPRAGKSVQSISPQAEETSPSPGLISSRIAEEGEEDLVEKVGESKVEGALSAMMVRDTPTRSEMGASPSEVTTIVSITPTPTLAPEASPVMVIQPPGKRIETPVKGGVPSSSPSMTCTGSLAILSLLVAFGFHSVFEGVAIGLQRTETRALRLAGVLLIHKVLEILSFAIAMRQLTITLNLRAFLIFSICLPLPLGILLAMGIYEQVPWRVNAAMSGTVDAVVGGAMLYIAMVTMMSNQIALHGHSHSDEGYASQESPEGMLRTTAEGDVEMGETVKVDMAQLKTPFSGSGRFTPPRQKRGYSRSDKQQNLYWKNLAVAIGALATTSLIFLEL